MKMLKLSVLLSLAAFPPAELLASARPMDGHGGDWQNYYHGSYYHPNQVNGWPSQNSQPEPSQYHHSDGSADPYWSHHAVGSNHPPEQIGDWQSMPASPSFEEEQAFLNSLLEDLSPSEHAQAELEGPSNPTKPLNEDNPRKGEWARSYDTNKKASVAGYRQSMGWPEPRALTQLPYLKPMAETKANGPIHVKPQEYVPALRKTIVEDVFGGHLQWFDLRQVPDLQRGWSRKTPVAHTSRILPIAPIAAPLGTGASRVTVHMTEHNVGQGPREQFPEQLHGRPYYIFWGMPDKSEGGRNFVYFYGAGSLDKKHNEAVDAHLSGLIDVAGEASRIHI